jgi:hypothetical protein
MNKITVTDENFKNNKITLNFTGSVKNRDGDNGEWFTSSDVIDLETKLTTNSGKVFDLGILKGEGGDSGVFISDAYLNGDTLILVDSQSNEVVVGSVKGADGNTGTNGLYPVSVIVDNENYMTLTMNDNSILDVGLLSTRIMKIGDVVATYRSELDSDLNYLKLDNIHFLLKADYPELHYHAEYMIEDDVFFIEPLFLSDMNVYMKAK